MSRRIRIFALFAASLLLSSCGGGGSGTVAEGGIGGTGISTGRVAQVGSVVVNGIHYNTDSATFVVDGVQLTGQAGLDQISVGMVVQVTGSKDDTTLTGTAEEVRYESLIKGPVDIAFLNGTLGAMGQTILTNSDTVFMGDATHPLLTDLTVGVNVEISGFSDGQGTILATRIEVESSPLSSFKVAGIANNVDNVNNNFEIGSLTILAGTIPAQLPAEGSFVLVTGSSAPVRTDFTADNIALLGNGDGTVGDDGDEVEFEGHITIALGATPLAADQFAVNGQIVQLLGSTQIEDGDSSDLVIDRIVEVEGVMDGSILLAEKIEIEVDEASKEELGGTVTDVSVGGAGNGTITLLGQTVQVNNSTILESDLDGESTFTLSELQAGLSDGDPNNDYVEASVFVDTVGDLVATKVEREDLPRTNHAELEGTITNFTATTFVIAGVTVDYTTATLVGGIVPADGVKVEVIGTFDGVEVNAETLSPSD